MFILDFKGNLMRFGLQTVRKLTSHFPLSLHRRQFHYTPAKKADQSPVSGFFSTSTPQKTSYGNGNLTHPNLTRPNKFITTQEPDSRSKALSHEPLPMNLTSVANPKLLLEFLAATGKNAQYHIVESPFKSQLRPSSRTQEEVIIKNQPSLRPNSQTTLPPATTKLSMVPRGLPSDRYRGLSLKDIFEGKTNY
jgi:hypothetical protein